MRPSGGDRSVTLAYERLRLGDFDPSWVGPNPLIQGIAIGSDNGRILLTDEQFKPILAPSTAVDSGEAINGIAGHQLWVAVSTRSDVTFTHVRLTVEEGSASFNIPVGAHGVVATRQGHFVCPLGFGGVMIAKPPFADPASIVAYRTDEDGLYFYSAVSFGGVGREILAFAARKDGIAWMSARPDVGNTQANFISSEGLDMVDVCPLHSRERPFAAAALGRDGTIVLFSHIGEDRQPANVKFTWVEGTAYRLLCSRGDFYLLTSKGLYVLAGLAGRFLRGETAGTHETPILPLPMDGVDIAIHLDRWLFIVDAEGVQRLDTDAIRASAPSGVPAPSATRRQKTRRRNRERRGHQPPPGWDTRNAIVHREQPRTTTHSWRPRTVEQKHEQLQVKVG